MAKNRKVKDDWDDDFGLDSGLDDDFFDFDMEPPRDNRKPSIKFKDGAVEGLKEGLKDSDYLRSLTRDVFPKGYGDTLDAGSEALTRAKDLYESTAKELKPAISSFKKTVTKMFPKDSTIGSIFKDTLNEWREEIEAEKSGNLFNQNVEQQRESMLSSQMAELFSMQADQHEAERKETANKEALKAGVDTKRYQAQIDLSNRSAMALDRMQKYQTTIDLNYKKKNLELQYRQLFAQQDILQTLRTTLQLQGETLADIKKNTGLPEYVKQTNAEFLKEFQKKKFTEAIGNNLFGGGRDYMERVMKNLSVQVGRAAKSLKSGMQEGLGAAEQFAEMINGGQGSAEEIAGNMLGESIVQKAGRGVGKFVKKNVIDKSEKTKELGYMLSNRIAEMPAKLNEFRMNNKDNYDDGLFSSLFRGVAGLLLPPQTRTEVKKNDLNNLGDPATYSNKAERSITEVIPGYLARILREQTRMRLRTEKVDLVTYDYDSGKFMEQKKLTKKIESEVYGQGSKDALHQHLDQMVSDFGGDALSPAGRKALKNQLARYGSNNRTFSAENFGKTSKYKDKEGAEEAAALMANFFKDIPQDLLSVAINDFKNIPGLIGNTEDRVQKYAYAGQQEALQGMNALSADGRSIDKNAMLEEYLKSGYKEREKPKPAQPEADSTAYPEGQFVGPMRQTHVERLGRRFLGSTYDEILNAEGTSMDEAFSGLTGKLAKGADFVSGSIMDMINKIENPDDLKKFLGKKWEKLKQKVGDVKKWWKDQRDSGREPSDIVRDAVDIARDSARDNVNSLGNQLSQTKAFNIIKILGLKADKRIKEFKDNELKKIQDAVMTDGQFDPGKMDQIYNDLSGRLDSAAQKQLDNLKRRLGDGQIPNGGSDDGAPPSEENVPHFAKGGLFNKAILDRPKKFLMKVGNRIKEAVAGEAGQEAIVPVDDGGVQLLGLGGERQGVLPLVRDREGRLSVMSSLLDGAEDANVLSENGTPTGNTPRAAGAEVPPRAAGSEEQGASMEQMMMEALQHLASIDAQLLNGIQVGSNPSLIRQAYNIGRVGFKWGLAKPLSLFGTIFKKSAEMSGRNLARAGQGAAWLGGKAKDMVTGVKDVYVEGDPIVRLKAKHIKQGVYVTESGRAIYHQDEIIGVLKDRDGNTVISADEVDKLYTRGALGKMVKLVTKGMRKFLRGVGAYGRNVLKPLLGMQGRMVRSAFRTIGKMGAGLYNFFDKPTDIYVRGEEDPALLATVMKNGGYHLKKDGTTITRPTQINGVVVDDDGNVVLSLDQLRKGITDVQGRPIRSPALKALAGIGSLIKGTGKLVMKTTKAAWKLSKRFAGALWGGAKRIGRTIGRGVKGMLGIDSHKDGTYLASMESVDLLSDIRNILDSRLPNSAKVAGDSDGDGVKDGSLSDLRRRAKAAREKAASARNALYGNRRNKSGKKEDSSLLGGIGDLLTGLKGLFSGGSLLKTAGSLLGMGGLTATATTAAAGTAAAGTAAAGTAAATTGAAAAGGLGVGGMLATAGGTALAALTSPITLGVAAAALLGYGAYKAYKYVQNNPGPFDEIRMSQYGFITTDHSLFGKVRTLENMIDPTVKLGPEGASFDAGKINLKEAMEIFGLNSENKTHTGWFLGWFQNRFKPVYLNSIAIYNHFNGGKNSTDTSLIKKTDWPDVYKAVKFESGPYSYLTLPNGDSAVKRDVVDAVYASVKRGYNIPDEKTDKFSPLATKGSALDVPKKDVQTQVKEAEKETRSVAASTQRQVAKEVLGTAAKSASMVAASKLAVIDTQLLQALKGKQDELGSLQKETADLLNSLDLKLSSMKGKLSAIDAARYKAYGLTTLDPDKVAMMVALENELSKFIDWSKGPEAVKDVELTAKMTLALHQQFPWILFGNNDETVAVRNWFRTRFLYIYLVYHYGLIKRGKNATDDGSALKPSEQVEIIKLFQGSNVWSIEYNPFDEYAINSDSTSLNENINFLQDLDKTKALVEEKKAQAETVKKDISTLKSSVDAQKTAASSPVTASTAPTSSFTGPVGTSAAPSSITAPTGGSSVSASTVDVPAKPELMGDFKATGKEDVKKIVTDAANIVGVDPSIAMSTVALESDFNPNAKAGTSSAKGLYQFIDSTWKNMAQKYGPRYGYDPKELNPLDPQHSALMGAHFIKENVSYMAQKTGDPNVTATDTYAAHFLGPAGAAQLINAVDRNPGMSAPDLMPGPAAANKPIFYNGNTPRSVSEVYQVLDKKVVGKARQFGINTKADSSVKVEKVAKDTYSPSMIASNNTATPAPRSRLDSGTPGINQAIYKPAPAAEMRSTARADTPISSSAVSAMARSNASTGGIDLSKTENLLTQQLQIQTKILEIMQLMSGQAPQKGGTNDNQPTPAPSPMEQASVTQSGSTTYAMPKLPVSMRRAA